MWTTIDTLAMVVLFITALAVIRWRAWGMVASTVLGFVTIHLIHVTFTGASRHDQESLQEWPSFGLFVMAAWSLLVFGAVKLYSRLRQRKRV
jgi:hypothetical protein